LVGDETKLVIHSLARAGQQNERVAQWAVATIGILENAQRGLHAGKARGNCVNAMRKLDKRAGIGAFVGAGSIAGSHDVTPV
jgi:hypothetical protein